MIYELPAAFTERMREQLGTELAAFLRSLEEPPLRGIRINPLKKSRAADRYTGTEPVPWAEYAYYLPADSDAGASVLHEEGAYYIQEPGAMMPAAVLDAQPGEKILDLCAAPGGKSTQIGCAMQGDGLLVCNEPVFRRAQILSRNIERMGLPNCVVTCAMPGQLAERWPEGFDAVLVDAPCSGEGMFRRDPLTRNEWTKEKAEGCAVRQREILASAAKLVRPGGRLVYSTCTYHPEENERNVQWFVSRFPVFHTEPFSLPGIDAPGGMFTCYPHRVKGEGQFAALLRKDGSRQAVIPADRSIPAPTRADSSAFEKAFPAFPRATHVFGNTMIHMPELPDLKGIRTLRAGLHLGEIRGNNAIPDHAAALCFRTPEVQMISMDAEQAVRFMSGETIPGDARGWVLMMYEGLAAGWGKGSEGTIKNHYPKGLRGSRFIP